MKIKWLGHAAFLISSAEGIKVITDPYSVGSGLSYGKIDEPADIVTVSHDHFDHNNAGEVPGKPEVVEGSGSKRVKGIEFLGIPCYHDEAQGGQRGPNTIFCFAVDNVRICHLGDLGHRLSADQVAQIGEVDVLFIPVGGFYTIDAALASEVSDQLRPRVVIPMHFKTAKCDFPITGVEEFLRGKALVQRTGGSEVELVAGKLPGPGQVVVLEPTL